MWEGLGEGVTGCALPNIERSGERSPGKEGDGEGEGDKPRTYRMAFPEKS